MLMSSLMGKCCNKKNPYVQLFLFLFCYLRHLMLRKIICKPTNKIIVAFSNGIRLVHLSTWGAHFVTRTSGYLVIDALCEIWSETTNQRDLTYFHSAFIAPGDGDWNGWSQPWDIQLFIYILHYLKRTNYKKMFEFSWPGALHAFQFYKRLKNPISWHGWCRQLTSHAFLNSHWRMNSLFGHVGCSQSPSCGED
jgi:hypothetical protein